MNKPIVPQTVRTVSAKVPDRPKLRHIQHLAKLNGLSNVERGLVAYWMERRAVPQYQMTCFTHLWRKHCGGRQ
jgi:hypothetical protein